jgi:hypothetical protein
VNIQDLLDHVEATPPTENKMLRFATYPGLANCATKVGYKLTYLATLNEFLGYYSWFSQANCFLLNRIDVEWIPVR